MKQIEHQINGFVLDQGIYWQLVIKTGSSFALKDWLVPLKAFFLSHWAFTCPFQS
jgi:hypothetical protein